MRLRIAIWAVTGALVSLSLALYFSVMPGTRLGNLWLLVDLSCPIALLRHHAMTYYLVTLYERCNVCDGRGNCGDYAAAFQTSPIDFSLMSSVIRRGARRYSQCKATSDRER